MTNKKIKKLEKKYVYTGRKLPVKPEIVGLYLTELIEGKGGKITAKQLVSEAKNKKNPLHKCFCWDDTKAAYLYRLEQARGILQSVRVEIIDPGNNNMPITVSAFTNIKAYPVLDDDANNPKSDQFYTTMEITCHNLDYYKYYYEQGLQELKRIRDKYAQVKEFYNIFNEIAKLKK